MGLRSNSEISRTIAQSPQTVRSCQTEVCDRRLTRTSLCHVKIHHEIGVGQLDPGTDRDRKIWIATWKLAAEDLENIKRQQLLELDFYEIEYEQ